MPQWLSNRDLLFGLWKGIEVFNCLSRPRPQAKLSFLKLKVRSTDS